jgi:hypothetical protein
MNKMAETNLEKIKPIEEMVNDCKEGDIIKVLFEKGGFQVGVYRGVSEGKPRITNVYGETENSSLNWHSIQDWIIFIPGKRKVFCSNTREEANIKSYLVLERYAQSSPKCKDNKKLVLGHPSGWPFQVNEKCKFDPLEEKGDHPPYSGKD